MVRALVLALLVTTSLAAAPLGTVHVIPTAPTNLTPIVLTFSGTPVSAPSVRREGDRVEIRFLDVDPATRALARQNTVLLGTLPPGDYQVVVTLRDGVVAQEFPLQVRDVTTLPIVFPWITPDDDAVLEWKYLGPVPPQLYIDGERVFYGSYAPYVSIRPWRELPPGLYDVEVRWPDGKIDVARNSVEVTETAVKTPFGARMLLPILFTGAGAYGTEWVTEYDFEALDYSFLSRWYGRSDGPEGAWQQGVSPRYERRRAYYLRVRAEAPSGPWASIPAVPETEFRPSARITNVPAAGGKRVTLRLYSVVPATITVSGDGFERQVSTTGGGVFGPAFASLDLSGVLAGESDLVLIGNAPFWAMTSSFDPETRALIIRTP
jgi:hypothetical protein